MEARILRSEAISRLAMPAKAQVAMRKFALKIKETRGQFVAGLNKSFHVANEPDLKEICTSECLIVRYY